MCKQLLLSAPPAVPCAPTRPVARGPGEFRAAPSVTQQRGLVLLSAASVQSFPHQFTPQEYPRTVISGRRSYCKAVNTPGTTSRLRGERGAPQPLFLPVSLPAQSQLNDQTLEVKTRTTDSSRTAAGQRPGLCRGRPSREGMAQVRKVHPAEPECALPRLRAPTPELGAHVVAAMVHFSKNQLALF